MRENIYLEALKELETISSEDEKNLKEKLHTRKKLIEKEDDKEVDKEKEVNRKIPHKGRTLKPTKEKDAKKEIPSVKDKKEVKENKENSYFKITLPNQVAEEIGFNNDTYWFLNQYNLDMLSHTDSLGYELGSEKEFLKRFIKDFHLSDYKIIMKLA